MSIIDKIFGKTAPAPEVILKEAPRATEPVCQVQTPGQRIAELEGMLSDIQLLSRPRRVDKDYMTLYRTVPEVFWPVDFIAKRISEAHFDIKRTKDDSIVWCNRLGVDKFLKGPNPVMTWRELVYQHFTNKLVTGNAFLRAAMPETISPDAPKCQWAPAFWELPASQISVEPAGSDAASLLYGLLDRDEIIRGFRLRSGAFMDTIIPAYQVWHDRDGMPDMCGGGNFLKSRSRLEAVLKPIANLLAVYEARNVIYVKRGGLGFIVAQKSDATGTVALEPGEKEELRAEVDRNYGVTEGKSPYAVTDIPIDFVRTNLSISDLQPFDEVLEDTIKIAGVFGIPAVLVPRKDQSTFNNQGEAEKTAYTSTIIPMAKRFCEELTIFLGLDQKGLYLDCDFSDVACLQVGLKESEQVKKLTNERCLSEFANGLISINAWRAQIHEDALEGDIYDKVRFEMTPEEREQVSQVIALPAPKTQEENTDNNNKPSKGESDERNNEEPAV